jgi:hypothetical protein
MILFNKKLAMLPLLTTAGWLLHAAAGDQNATGCRLSSGPGR